MGRVPNQESAHSLKAYTRELEKSEPLSRTEECALALRARNGDLVARDLLVEANLRLGFAVASRYRTATLPLGDLVAAANVGLVWAASRYDPRKGARFGTYATYWIHRQIREALDNGAHHVRLPQRSGERLQTVLRVADDLYNKRERRITVLELAEAVELPVATVTVLVSFCPRLLRTCLLGGQDGLDATSSQNAEPIERRERFDHVFEIRQEVNFLLSRLTEREAFVIRSFYGLSNREIQSMAEIGRQLGLTRERVRQIRKEALERLRGFATR